MSEALKSTDKLSVVDMRNLGIVPAGTVITVHPGGVTVAYPDGTIRELPAVPSEEYMPHSQGRDLKARLTL